MAEQSISPECQGISEAKIFQEPQKQLLLDKTCDQIVNNLRQINKEIPDKTKQEQMKFGSVFENLASEEERQKNNETEKQKRLRELIVNMYKQAELILGTAHERPSKPDGINISFDNQGKLVIDEIIELKSSENAFIHGLDKEQPPKTLETIGNVVNILNKLISGEKTVSLKPIDPELPLDKRIKRDTKLQEIQKQVHGFIQSGEKITFSPDMVYKIIVPKGVRVPEFNPHYLEEYGYISVKMDIAESSFSKQDIHQIINKLS